MPTPMIRTNMSPDNCDRLNQLPIQSVYMRMETTASQTRNIRNAS